MKQIFKSNTQREREKPKKNVVDPKRLRKKEIKSVSIKLQVEEETTTKKTIQFQ